MTQPPSPNVSVIVVPRESFGYTEASLASLLANTSQPYELIYVDAGSPRKVRDYIAHQSKKHGFTVIRTEEFLSPNRARNLGLRAAQGQYVAFVDNDILLQDGWLGRLVQTAEETGAAIVGPLSCIGRPLHQLIHNGGGETTIEEQVVDGRTVRRISQITHLANRLVDDVADDLIAFKCDYVEFHTVLVRRSLFDEIGELDEKLLSTREHIDLCLMAAKAGHTIYCERRAAITYVPGVKPSLADTRYFMLRWSNAWDLASLDHFRAKWNLDEDTYFLKRYKKLGKRRQRAIITPIKERVPVGRDLAERVLLAADQRLHSAIVERYAKRHEYARHSLGVLRDPRAEA